MTLSNFFLFAEMGKFPRRLDKKTAAPAGQEKGGPQHAPTGKAKASSQAAEVAAKEKSTEAATKVAPPGEGDKQGKKRRERKAIEVDAEDVVDVEAEKSPGKLCFLLR